MDYNTFLDSKAHLDYRAGFEPLWIPEFLYDFQKALTEWAIRKGRAAIWADCGMGKTPMQLVWAANVCGQTQGRVLIVTPLAVGPQTIREGEKFKIECKRSLKNFDGKRKAVITEFLRTRPYRLLCTATAAPNDYIELGTTSEALGVMGYIDMLGRYFKNLQSTVDLKGQWRQHSDIKPKWRFKMHAETPFWKWVCSWARALRRPSDMGFDDGAFILPELIERETIVRAERPFNGELFPKAAVGLREQREERRLTIQERCETVAGMANGSGPIVVWCHLNKEADLLEQLIPDAKQVSGSQSDDEKEETFLAFSSGELRALVTKPRIGAFGLNWQHCNRMTFFPSHSFEQYYQGVRRCWRFGQKNPVTVDIVTTEGELDVLKNLQRKANAADKMFSELVKYMNESMEIKRDNPFTENERLPAWL
jgi:hypothetical protein